MPRLLSFLLLASAVLTAQGLEIVNATISAFAGGNAVPADREFLAGERVHLSFAAKGFKSIADTGNIFLEYVVEPVDCHGVLFDKPLEGRTIVTTRRAESRPFRVEFSIPQAPRSGEGKFRVTVHDRVGEQVARTEVPFLVASDLADPSGEFEVTAFQYFSSEYSDQPLTNPRFRAGETAWGRFYLSGYRTVESNRYRLSYGVTLREKSGRVVFQEQQAVSESKESFYPRTHVPGLISVRLESTIRPGDYVLEIAAADEIAKAKTVATVPLRVN